MTELFKNKSARRVVVLLLAVFMLLTAIGFAVLYQNNRSMTKAFIRQDTALVGGMAQNKPVTQLSILTGNVSDEDVNAGNALLKQYSFDTDMPIAINRYYQSVLDSQLRVYALWAAAFFVIVLLVILAFMSRYYIKLRELSNQASSLDFSGDAEETNEGDFAALQSTVNSLAQRTNFHIDSLKRDKDYLKNLLSDISHQLKTPLAALRMYNEILLEKPDLNIEKRTEFLDRSKNQIDRTDWLIQGLLKMARVEAGAVEMNSRYTYLIDTVEQAIAPFCEFARQKGVTLALEISPKIQFEHDSDWVAEAMGNIIKNALEHTPAGKTIRIEAEETPLTVAIKIRDNGEGMTTAEIPHIFERFYHKNAGANTGNAGIGLSLAKEILEKNGGEIFVKSAPECGSEFTITFLKKS